MTTEISFMLAVAIQFVAWVAIVLISRRQLSGAMGELSLEKQENKALRKEIRDLEQALKQERRQGPVGLLHQKLEVFLDAAATESRGEVDVDLENPQP